MQRLDRLWRISATGLSFAVFGLGALVISCTFFPVIHLISNRREIAHKRCQFIVHLSFKVFIRVMSGLGIITYQIDDTQRLANSRGNVIVANHPSLIDVVFIVSIVPHACCIVKKGVWINPFFWGVVRATGYIQNEEPEVLLKNCLESLARGNNLIVFPEGTRTVAGQPLNLRRGAAAIIARSDRPFIPLIITCSPTTLTKAEKWYQIPPRRAHFRISVGESLDWRSLVQDEVVSSVVNRRLTQSMKDIFEEGILRHERLG